MVEVRLVLDVFDIDAQAVLGEDDVVLAHLLAGLRLDLDHGQVDLVADPGQAGQEEERDDQGQQLPVWEVSLAADAKGEMAWRTDLIADGGGGCAFGFPQAMMTVWSVG